MKRNYWPVFFILIFLYTLFMVFWTLHATMITPVNDDDSFLTAYHKVDKNFNNYIQANKLIKEKYNVTLLVNNHKRKLDFEDVFYGQRVIDKSKKFRKILKDGKNIIEVKITDKQGKAIKNVKIKMRVNIATDDKLDIDLNNFVFEKQSYIKRFSLPHKGNWNITGVFDIQGHKAYLFLKTNIEH